MSVEAREATTAAVPFVFKGKTVDELRRELNEFAAQIVKEFRTEVVVTKGVQFIPVAGPQRASEAPLGLVYMRLAQWQGAGDEPGRALNFIAPWDQYLGKRVINVLVTNTVYNNSPGGLLGG